MSRHMQQAYIFKGTRANIEFRVPYSQQYLVLGLVGSVGLVGLGLPLLLPLGNCYR